MASEVIKLNIIPTGEMPVFHCSQFDNGRLINIELYRGEDAYTIPSGCTAELHCRKVDNNIVTIGSPVIDENTIKFTSTTQLTACNGKNLCEVAILGADDYLIGSLNFWLEVEVDPLKGGITSTSEIHNLESQIEEITTEIIGENYYDKSEVDDLLDAKADASSVYTKTETDAKLALKANASSVYTKSETDTLLLTKADASDVYTKAQIETKLVSKADVSDLPDMTDYYTKTATDALLDEKADQSTTYTKTEVDNEIALKANELIASIFPTKTASGAIASFKTAMSYPLVSVTTAAGATKVTRTGTNLINSDYIVIASYPYSSMTFDKAVFLKAGTYMASISNVENAASWRFGFRFYDSNGNIITSAITTGLVTFTSAMTLSDAYDSNQTCLMAGDTTTTTVKMELTADTYVVCCISNGNVGSSTTLNYQIQTGESATAYEAYQEITKTVSEADMITTLQGNNNIFADVGNITVQYKDTTV